MFRFLFDHTFQLQETTCKYAFLCVIKTWKAEGSVAEKTSMSPPQYNVTAGTTGHFLWENTF